MYTFNQLEVNDILYLGFESKNDKLMTSFSMFRDNQIYFDLSFCSVFIFLLSRLLL